MIFSVIFLIESWSNATSNVNLSLIRVSRQLLFYKASSRRRRLYEPSIFSRSRRYAYYYARWRHRHLKFRYYIQHLLSEYCCREKRLSIFWHHLCQMQLKWLVKLLIYHRHSMHYGLSTINTLLMLRYRLACGNRYSSSDVYHTYRMLPPLTGHIEISR